MSNLLGDALIIDYEVMYSYYLVLRQLVSWTLFSRFRKTNIENDGTWGAIWIADVFMATRPMPYQLIKLLLFIDQDTQGPLPLLESGLEAYSL